MHKKLALSLSLLGLASVQPALAQVNVSVDIANQYVFRGLDLSHGTPALSGLLEYQHKTGLYTGIWSSSGDATLGTEVDYYAGFRGETNDFHYGVQYLNYYYPESRSSATPIVDFNDYAEVTGTFGFKDFSMSVTHPTRYNVAGKYTYYTFSYDYKAFSVSTGINQHHNSASSYAHIDLSYHYNKYLSFGLSQIVYRGNHSSLPSTTLWQFSFHLPLEFPNL